MTALFTMVEEKDRDGIVLSLAKSGYSVSIENSCVQVVVDTPLIYGENYNDTNVDSIVRKLTITIKGLNNLTDKKWYIASSHPLIIEKYNKTIKIK